MTQPSRVTGTTALRGDRSDAVNVRSGPGRLAELPQAAREPARRAAFLTAATPC